MCLMKDVVYMTAAAWEDVSSLTVQKSWNKLNDDEVVELAQQLDSNLDVNGWMAVDNNDMGYQLLSDEDIIKEVTQSEEVEDIEEHEDTSEEDPSTIPTPGEVKDMLDQCLLLENVPTAVFDQTISNGRMETLCQLKATKITFISETLTVMFIGCNVCMKNDIVVSIFS